MRPARHTGRQRAATSARYLFALLAGVAISCAPKTSATAVKPARIPQPAMERQVVNAIDAGDGDIQVTALRKRMAADPNDLGVRMELAKLYDEKGHSELALEHYRLAAERFPESADLQLRLARSLRQAGQRAAAVKGLEAFLAAHPQAGPQYQSWLGILHDELNQWPEGEKAHRAALALAPRLDYLHNNLGYNLMRQGREAEAQTEFQEALRINPRSAVAHNNLATTLASRPEEAILHWQSVSDPATAHSNLAAVLIEEGRYAEARRELDIALGYNRYHSAALENLRLVSRLDGKPASIPLKPVSSRWARWKASMKKLFLEDPQQQKGTPDQTGSASQGTGPQDRRGS